MDTSDGAVLFGSHLGDPAKVEPLNSYDPVQIGPSSDSRSPEMQAEPLLAGNHLPATSYGYLSSNEASEPPSAKRPHLDPPNPPASSTPPAKPKRPYQLFKHPGCSVTANYGPDGTVSRQFWKSHKPLLCLDHISLRIPGMQENVLF